MAPHPSRLFAEFIIGPTKPDPVALKRATLPTARSYAALEGGKAAYPTMRTGARPTRPEYCAIGAGRPMK